MKDALLIIEEKWQNKIKNYNNKIIFKNKKYFYKNKEIKIENQIIFYKNIIVFLDNKIENLKLENLLKHLNINYFLNHPFFEKSNKEFIKHILINKKIKTPIFEKIKNNQLKNIFFNFPQPSILFDENYKKIKKIEIFQDINNINNTNNKYFIIEEFLKGEIFWIFYLKIFNRQYTFIAKQLKNNELAIADVTFNDLIKKWKNEVNTNIALLKIIKTKKRGNYILNLKTNNNIIFEDNRIKEILELNDLELNDLI